MTNAKRFAISEKTISSRNRKKKGRGMTMRVLVIGAGGMANSHFEAYSHMPDVELVAIADTNYIVAQRAAARFSCKAFQNADEMLQTCHADAVDLCIPSFLHYTYTMKCLKMGLHVFCEKPMAHTAEEADEMIAFARKQNLFLGIGQVLRFWPEYQALKKMVLQEPYGPLRFLKLDRQFGTHEKGSWYMDPDKCKMVCFEMHIHDSDFVNYLFGLPNAVDSIGVEEPNIHMSYISTRYLYDNRNTVIIGEGGWSDSTLEFAGGYKAVFEHAVLEYKNGSVTLYAANATPEVLDMRCPEEMPSDIYGVYTELSEFYGAIAGTTANRTVTAESARNTIRIVEKEYQSVQQRKALRV